MNKVLFQDEEAKIKPIEFILALLGAWEEKHPGERILQDQFYYAISKIACCDLPAIFKGWDFYASSSTSILSDNLEDIVNMMCIWSQITIVKGSRGICISVVPQRWYIEKFPDQEFLNRLADLFKIYIEEPISTKHLEN
ncbi:MAG: hypothetical protein Q8P20_01395 [bacterium]|nr:hypothetical protein [bacterium]